MRELSQDHRTLFRFEFPMAGFYGAALPPGSRLGRVRDRIRGEHYSILMEHAYCDWIRRSIIFHGKRHPPGLGAAEVELF